MGKQASIFKLEGLIDDVSFYRTSDGYKARKKGGVSADRMANDPAFRKQRATMSDFTRAARAGKLIRTSIEEMLNQATDGRMVSRLTKQLFKVLQADKVHPKGQRNVIDGESELLTGFEFNVNASLSAVVKAGYLAAIDRASGELKIDFGSIVPRQALVTPKDVTHYQIKVAGVAIDFEQGVFVSDKKETAPIVFDQPSAPVQLVCQLPANSTYPLFLIVGVDFYAQEEDLSSTLIKEHSNPLAIVRVSGV